MLLMFMTASLDTFCLNIFCCINKCTKNYLLYSTVHTYYRKSCSHEREKLEWNDSKNFMILHIYVHLLSCSECFNVSLKLFHMLLHLQILIQYKETRFSALAKNLLGIWNHARSATNMQCYAFFLFANRMY